MRRSSQDLWTEGEALERAGKAREAMDLFVRAATAEEDARKPLRAKLLWEQIASRVGISGTVLERLASVCQRGNLADDAFDYWAAATARFQVEGRADDAARARAHALELKKRLASHSDPHHSRPELAARAIEEGRSFVQDLLGLSGT